MRLQEKFEIDALGNEVVTPFPPSSKSTFSQTFSEECMREVMRLGNIMIFRLSKLRIAKFLVCDVIFLVRLQVNLKSITLWSEFFISNAGCL